MEEETNADIKSLGKDYIRFIQALGNREALSRRFFLIFQYESQMSPNRGKESYSGIVNMMSSAEQAAKVYLRQCGNEVVSPAPGHEDEAICEILYTWFNRRSCVKEPFQSRVNRVVLDAMRSKGRTLGIDPVPKININHFFSPRGLDLRHISYLVMDGLYYSFLYIRSDGYPTHTTCGWVSSLINAGEGIDVDIHLVREDRGKSIDRVAQKIRLNRAKLHAIQDTSSDYDELANSIQAGYYIKSGIANNNEDLFYLSILITVTAPTYDELLWRRRGMIDMLKSMDIYSRVARFQMEDALKSVLPLNYISPSIFSKSRRNLLTSSAANCYPYTSYEMSDEAGVLLGVNQYNNSLCILDPFNTAHSANGNFVIVGTSGAGKTFTMLLLALRMRMRQIQCFIIAPIKGHEFRRACKAVGGQYIQIAPGSPDCINIMEIRQTISPDMSLIDDVDYNATESLLSSKVQELLIFFSLLIPDMTNEEEQMVDEAILNTYAAFGITTDNDSLYEDIHANPPKMKKMPILGDLYLRLKENPLTQRIALILSRYVTGSAQSFNRQTNVDLTNKFVVVDLSKLTGRSLVVGMFIALVAIYSQAKTNRTEEKAILLDEIWQMISSNPMAAQFCVEIFKIIRGYGGAAFAATQDLHDFFTLDEGRFGRAIVNVSKNRIILNLESDEAAYVQDIMKLTDSEIKAITRFERGQALVCSGGAKIPISIKASPIEAEMITTDRAELKQILQKNKEKSRTETGESSGGSQDA